MTVRLSPWCFNVLHVKATDNGRSMRENLYVRHQGEVGTINDEMERFVGRTSATAQAIFLVSSEKGLDGTM
jgi:hypothetical protein